MGPDFQTSPAPRKLPVGYTIAIAALIINTLITFWNLSAIRDTWDTLMGGRDFVLAIDGLLSALKDAETGQRGFLLTGDHRYLEPYTKSRADLVRSIDRLQSLAGNNDRRRRHLTNVAEACSAKLAELEKTIAVRRQNGLAASIEIIKTDRGEEAMDRLRGDLAAMRADEEATRDWLRQRLQAAITRTTLTFSFASVFALALLFGVHVVNERSRDQVQRNAAWLSTTLRSIGDAVIATDGQGRVRFMNPVAEGLTGWTNEEARGKPLDDLFQITNEATGAVLESPVSKVLREGVTVGSANHTVLRARDGTERPIEDTAAPIKERDQVEGIVLVFHDATAVREAERRILESDKRKDEFLAMLGHELRNPIAAIGNAVMLSMRSGVQEHIDWSMEVIKRQTEHLSRLIDDLLDVSRISRGKIELRRALLDLAPTLESAVATVRPLVEKRKHELSTAIDRDILWVNADPTRLEQVFINLLANAAKYTDSGGHIWLTARREDGDVVVRVKDSGIGIPPEKLPEMFELFAQGDRTLARSEGGLGIGLTVVKKLVEAHGGSVTGTSAGIGNGSEFSVRLPAANAPAANQSPDHGPNGSGEAAARILGVDDKLTLLSSKRSDQSPAIPTES